MLEEIFYFLQFISIYSGYPAIIFYILVLRFRKGNSRIIGYILIASFLSDLLAKIVHSYFYVVKVSHITNLWVVIDVFLIGWLFYKLIPNRQKQIFIALQIFILTAIVSTLLFYPYRTGNAITRIYASLFATVCIYWSFESIKRIRPVKNLLTYPVFWINVAFIPFFTVNIFRRLFIFYLFSIGLYETEFYYHASISNVAGNLLKNVILLLVFVLVWKGYPDYITKTSPVKSYNFKTQYQWVIIKVKNSLGKRRVKENTNA